MSRKGENIYRRKDKRWEGRYIASYSAEGKARYKSVYGKSYTEVKQKMKNQNAENIEQSFNIYLTDWVKQCLRLQKGNIKSSTLRVYERYFNNHIKPFFGNILLRKINRAILREFVGSLSELSPSTVRGIFSFLRECLKAAESEGYILPVWSGVQLPKPKKSEAVAFSREEQAKIEKSLDIVKCPNEVGILICLYAGLRIGEVCGLRWTDIDFNNKYMTINRTVQRITINGKSELRELPPKSESSRRKIPIPPCLLEQLRVVKELSKSEYVLSTDFHIMDPRTFQYQYKKLIERAGVCYSNAHTLRHTFSVRALELGFDVKTLSEILGHADAAVTLKIYAHSLDEHKRKSMEKFRLITT